MVKSRTLVATPAYRGEVVMQYAHSLVRDSVLAIVDGVYVEAPFFINDTYIHMARNRAVAEFVNSDFDYLMFIDADMGWSPGALGDILSLPERMDVVGGVYRVKEDAPRYPLHALVGIPIEAPVCEVRAVATGFMRISRSCLLHMLKKYPNGKLFNHIEDEHVPGGEWGDDFAFCIRARMAGCRVFAKLDIEFEHVGPKAWSGTASNHLDSIEMPTRLIGSLAA